jgi:hypothetical protein
MMKKLGLALTTALLVETALPATQAAAEEPTMVVMVSVGSPLHAERPASSHSLVPGGAVTADRASRMGMEFLDGVFLSRIEATAALMEGAEKSLHFGMATVMYQHVAPFSPNQPIVLPDLPSPINTSITITPLKGPEGQRGFSMELVRGDWSYSKSPVPLPEETLRSLAVPVSDDFTVLLTVGGFESEVPLLQEPNLVFPSFEAPWRVSFSASEIETYTNDVVALRGTITTDGRFMDIAVLSAPTQALGTRIANTARSWHFKPYLSKDGTAHELVAGLGVRVARPHVSTPPRFSLDVQVKPIEGSPQTYDCSAALTDLGQDTVVFAPKLKVNAGDEGEATSTFTLPDGRELKATLVFSFKGAHSQGTYSLRVTHNDTVLLQTSSHLRLD